MTPNIEEKTPNHVLLQKNAPIKKKQAPLKGKKGGQKLFDKEDDETEELNENIKTPLSVPNLSDPQNFLFLLSYFGEAYHLFCQYRCKEAIQAFQILPKNHLETGWVLTIIGRSYFEMNDYSNSEKTFEKVIENEPYRLEGLEFYSTVLWHQKKSKKLSWLSQLMSEINPASPYTQCTLGNWHSFQKDHKTALKHFQNAIKINEFFTYAHTLCGHEHFSNDDIEEALQCYRKAIRIDSRHYNAWYGLGKVFFRQQKYDLAEYHFQKASQINSKSPVLFCYIAMVNLNQSHIFRH